MTGEPVPAALDGLQPVERIRETVVRAREQAELARLLRALEEGARVGGRHHLLALPLHGRDPVESIRERVVRAREQAELARLLRALEEGARVGGRHHLVAFPLHDENMTGAGGGLYPMVGPPPGPAGPPAG